MRYLNQIFTAPLGRPVENETLRAEFEPFLAALPLAKDKLEELRNFVHYALVGRRTRHRFAEDYSAMRHFAARAATFESGATTAMAELAGKLAPVVRAAGVSFDAVITTTSTGNLMPGLSYRLAQRLTDCIRRDTLMIDLGNVGCTGSLKALQLARSLQDSFQHLLVLTVELPSTLADVTSTQPGTWKGNCTFGDGAAAVWLSPSPAFGEMALALEDMHYVQQAPQGFDLIRWDYRDYYTFALADEQTFNNQVRDFVVAALAASAAAWREEPHWAIHPAGIALLVRLSRKLGIPAEAMQPSLAHYRRFSNMSSASIIFILQELARATPVGRAINLLSMGAGFNVVYGRVRKVR